MVSVAIDFNLVLNRHIVLFGNDIAISISKPIFLKVNTSGFERPMRSHSSMMRLFHCLSTPMYPANIDLFVDNFLLADFTKIKD